MHKGIALKKGTRDRVLRLLFWERGAILRLAAGVAWQKSLPFRFVDFLGTRMGSRFLFSAGNKGSCCGIGFRIVGRVGSGPSARKEPFARTGSPVSALPVAGCSALDWETSRAGGGAAPTAGCWKIVAGRAAEIRPVAGTGR